MTLPLTMPPGVSVEHGFNITYHYRAFTLVLDEEGGLMPVDPILGEKPFEELGSAIREIDRFSVWRDQPVESKP